MVPDCTLGVGVIEAKEIVFFLELLEASIEPPRHPPGDLGAGEVQRPTESISPQQETQNRRAAGYAHVGKLYAAESAR